MKRRYLFAILVATVFAAVAPVAEKPADAQEATTLRIATLAPRGSQWDRAFRAWANTVQQDSGGRLRLHFYTGGSQGDERDYIRKMESGQLDGAAITTNGLGQIVRPVLVLSAPGLFTEYTQIDRARRELSDEMTREFEGAGYKFMGWGDVGRARFFSKRAITRPSDLRQTRPWTRPDDPIVQQFYSVIGVSPQRLGVNELLPGLQTGRVDAFPSSALAAVSLQWFQHATHVTEQPNSVIIGATVIKKERYDALPEDLRAMLSDTGGRAHAALLRSIRRADDQAYTAIVSRGVTAVDQTAHQAEWERVAQQTRERLAGRLYSRELLQRCERIASGGGR
jgi:TRAP-type C4-dicarboxylate transport system substrate-binding protein